MNEFFNNVINLMYIHWSVAIIWAVLSLATIYYYNFLLRPGNFRISIICLIVFIVVLPIYYFGISTPASIQTEFLQLERMYKGENPEFKEIYVAIEKAKVCEDGKVSSYDFFKLTAAISQDMELAFNKQKTFTTVPRSQYANKSKAEELICSL